MSKELITKIKDGKKLNENDKIELVNLLEDTKLGLKLYFEDSPEINDAGENILNKNYFYFDEEKETSEVDNNNDLNHYFYEGDNYFALKHLKKVGQKVDTIYIDPPYNTGKEFTYNDNLVNKEHSFKHSYWLSFMKKRLELAYDLLEDDGCIFISINDFEQAYIKVLMDQIFGESNFVCNFDWISKPGGQSDNDYIAKTKQYILFYTKSSEFKIRKAYKEIDESKIIGYLDDGTVLIGSTEINAVAGKDGSSPWRRPNLAYHLYYNPKTNEFKKTDSWDLEKEKPIPAVKMDGFLVMSPKQEDTVFRRKFDNIKESFDRKELYIKSIDEEKGTFVMAKTQAIYDGKKETFLSETLIRGITQADGTKDLKNIFDESGVFDYPKPIELIKELIKLNFKQEETVVLDFFAGSGTTAQAVMELNSEDNLNRTFIGVGIKENCKDMNKKCLDDYFLKNIHDGESCSKNVFKQVCFERAKKAAELYNLKNTNLNYATIKFIDSVDGNPEEYIKNKEFYKKAFNKTLNVSLIKH